MVRLDVKIDVCTGPKSQLFVFWFGPEGSAIFAPAERQVIIPNGIDEKNFGKVLLRRKELQTNGENTNKPFTLGLIGRVVPVKGILDFILAMKLLKEKANSPFQVWIIGGAGEDKAYAQSCLDLCSELRLNDTIKFCGEQNMTEVLLNIDLVILSSHSEALPMVILEAMASGISVVSTRVGCVVDMLEKELTSDSGQIIELVA